jgi:hypothetical protein
MISADEAPVLYCHVAGRHRSLNSLHPLRASVQLAIERGNIKMEDAKIGGITPGHVHPQRKVGALRSCDTVPDQTLGVLNRNPTLRTFHEDDAQDDTDDDAAKEHQDRKMLMPSLDTFPLICNSAQANHSRYLRR